jgi:hypothetical protein
LETVLKMLTSAKGDGRPVKNLLELAIQIGFENCSENSYWS